MKTLILIPSKVELRRLLGDAEPRPSTQGIPRYRCDGLDFALCGIGPAAAAMTTGLLLAHGDVERVLLLGIAGAMRGTGLEVGDLVQASGEVFADLGYQDAGGFQTLDEMNLAMATAGGVDLTCRYSLRALDPNIRSGPFATRSTITTDAETAAQLRRQFEVVAENMEGAAVAMACAAAGVKCYQLRAISNFVGPREPSTWRIDLAIASLREWMATRATVLLAK